MIHGCRYYLGGLRVNFASLVNACLLPEFVGFWFALRIREMAGKCMSKVRVNKLISGGIDRVP